jgi:hypothetical protein
VPDHNRLRKDTLEHYSIADFISSAIPIKRGSMDRHAKIGCELVGCGTDWTTHGEEPEKSRQRLLNGPFAAHEIPSLAYTLLEVH